MALGGAAWRNETRAWRRAMLKTPMPNTGFIRLVGNDFEIIMRMANIFFLVEVMSVLLSQSTSVLVDLARK